MTTDKLLDMTPDEHLRKAVDLLAVPVRGDSEGTRQLLRVLVHLGMAQVKQAARTT